MKKLIICTLCLFGFTLFGKAQMLNFNYQMSLPFNQVKDFTDKASFRGFDMGYHQFMGERFSLGLSVGWDVYYQDKNSVTDNFRFKNDEHTYTITGNQYRYLNYVPIMAIGRYYFTDDNTFIRPYAGLGLGTSWCEKRLEIGQFSSTIARWQFAMAPEIGMYMPLSNQFALNIGARYYYSTKAASGRVPEVQQLSFNVGIILMGNN